MHRVNSGDDQRMHYVVGVQVHVHHAGEPLFGDVRRAYCGSYRGDQVLEWKQNTTSRVLFAQRSSDYLRVFVLQSLATDYTKEQICKFVDNT